MRRIFRSRPNKKWTDEELLDAFKRTRDNSHLGILYDRYIEMIYGVGLKYLKNETEAEDATMSIYTELEEKILSHDISNFRGWLYVLARNYCLMLLRKKKKEIIGEWKEEVMHLGEEMHPINEATRKDHQTQALQDCLDGLKEKQKTCIELFYYQDYSYKEIATMKNESVGSIRSAIQNGRRMLKNCIDQQVKRTEKI